MPPTLVQAKTSFIMRENLIGLSSDSFTVKDASGVEAFKVKGSKLSLKEKKTLYSASGAKLYTMTEPVVEVGLRDSHYVSDADSGDVVYTLKKKGLIVGKRSLMVWEGKGDGGAHKFTVKGSMFRKNYDIKDADGKLVGEVDKKRFTATSLMTDKDTYAISVEAGQDAALVIAFAVIIDEIYSEPEEDSDSDDEKEDS